MPGDTDGPDRAGSQTLQRGLDVIEAVLEEGRTITEIATANGLAYSTTHRIVLALMGRGYLRRGPDHRVLPGVKLVQAGFAAHRSFDLVAIAQPYLRELARETSETVHLATLRGTDMLYLDKIPSRRPFEIRSWVGGLRPAITTGVGKASLVDMSPETVVDFFLRQDGTALTGLDPATWAARMKTCREEQVAFDLGESEPPIRCVAAPVRDASLQIVAAISVTSTNDYMPPSRMQELVPVIRRYATAISRDLGFGKA